MCIKFDIKVLLFLVIFYMTNQHKIYLIYIAFIILHEIAHLIVAVTMKVRPTIMEIKPVGCSISFRYEIDDYNRKILKGNLVELKKIFIYIAGPLFNLFVVIIALFFGKSMEIAYVNFVIFIINLIAIYPLDGGRIIKGIIHILCGEKRAYEIILKISDISFIIVLMSTSIMVLKLHNIGIIIGLIYISIIKEKYSKEIKLKLKIINALKNEEGPTA